MPKNFNKIMLTLYRLGAMVMFAVILLYAISGFGMTKGIIDADLARWLHFNILFPVGLAAFTVHTSWGIHLSMKRYRLWNKATMSLLILFYIALVCLGLYIWKVYDITPAKEAPPEISQDSEIAGQTADKPSIADEDEAEELPVFTAEMLAEYDGLDGRPAYAAVDGFVYDLTPTFENGEHKGHLAGQDLTEEFHGQHMEEILEKHEIIGTFEE